MQKLLAILFLALLWGGSARSQEAFYFAFRVEQHRELEAITRMISIDDVRGKTVYAYARFDQLWRFKNETSYDITHLPLPGHLKKHLKLASGLAGMQAWDQYPAYGQYERMMDSMASAHTAICRLDTIGLTEEGRRLLVMRITDHPNEQEDEPEVFYTSTMHGDETAGYVLMLRLIDTLISSYGESTRLTRLVNELDIYINPNANPDATYAGGNHTLSGATRYNANGVDLNRNFPDPETGPHPDGHPWQAETQAMMHFAAGRHIVLSANFHGGAEVANYPWDTWERRHPDDLWFRYLSASYAQSAQQNSPPGYFTGITSSGIINGYDWYPLYGGRQDYMNYFHQAREVTLEISDDKMPAGSRLRDLWTYNREALLLYMEEALHGIRGTVTNSSGDPLSAMVEVINHDTEQDSSMVFADPAVGNYHRMIEPGTYNLIFSAPGFLDKTVEGVEVSQGQSTRLDVVLEEAVGVPDRDMARFLDDLAMYPTPFHDHLTVEMELNRPATRMVIRVWDVQGRQLMMKEKGALPSGPHRFTLSFKDIDLPNGLLYVNFQTGRESLTRKVLHVR
jgi:hypothetical protein